MISTFEKVCEIITNNLPKKLSIQKLKRKTLEQISDIDESDLYLAYDWGQSLYTYHLPANATAYLNFGTHIQPIFIDDIYSQNIYRLTKTGAFKETPLDLSKSYQICFLFDNSDKFFEYFNVNTYHINENKIPNHLPIRRKQIGTFDLEVQGIMQKCNKYQIEFYYYGEWIDLLTNSKVYDQFNFKQFILNNTGSN